MTDFRHVWDSVNLFGDWRMAGPSLAADADIETSVIISLFTNRLANADDALPFEMTPDPIMDRQGWWGDTGAAEGPIGSRLWLLVREKWTNATRLRAEAYAREALQWMIDDGVAGRVDVEASMPQIGRIDLYVLIHRVDGRVFERRFDWAWQQLAAA